MWHDVQLPAICFLRGRCLHRVAGGERAGDIRGVLYGPAAPTSTPSGFLFWAQNFSMSPNSVAMLLRVLRGFGELIVHDLHPERRVDGREVFM